MKQFVYTIKDAQGIHARPAGMLAKEAARFAAVTTIQRGEDKRQLTRLMMLMSMGIKQGDRVTVCAEGADEDAAIEALRAFFEANL